jgi:hypothetical protein
MFQKSERVPALIIGEDANHVLMVTVPSVLHLPIFELHCGEGDRSIELQVYELLGGLLDAAKFEFCTNDTEPEGAFYGLLRTSYRVRSSHDGPWVEVAELGLAFSEESLIPHFDDGFVGVFENHVMDYEECQSYHLPFYEELLVPEPEVHRPTRFEREYVI